MFPLALPWMNNWPVVRDVALFAAGLLGVLHETVITTTERPALLLLFGAMMGLPAFLHADRQRRNGNGGKGD